MSISATNHGEDAPSGENLEYEKVFTDLMLAAQPGAERQAGTEIIPAQEPDFKVVVSGAEAVLAQSNDLRAALLYGYARLRLIGLPGLAEATGFVRNCLETYWDSCHPQLDADDDNDPTMRINAVLMLVERSTVLGALRQAPLADSPAFGRFSLRDVSMAEGETPVPEGMANPPTAQTIAAAFQDTAAATLEAGYGAVVAALADIGAINAVFDEMLPGQGPNLGDIQAMLKKLRSVLAPFVATAADPQAEQSPAAAASGGAAPAPAAAAGSGAISSQADVNQALGRIIDYYTKHEPSSPLPLLLIRARRLVGADFIAIMEDLAPLGLENVKLIGGMENPE